METHKKWFHFHILMYFILFKQITHEQVLNSNKSCNDKKKVFFYFNGIVDWVTTVIIQLFKFDMCFNEVKYVHEQMIRSKFINTFMALSCLFDLTYKWLRCPSSCYIFSWSCCFIQKHASGNHTIDTSQFRLLFFYSIFINKLKFQNKFKLFSSTDSTQERNQKVSQVMIGHLWHQM